MNSQHIPPRYIDRQTHGISGNLIPASAMKVLDRLTDAGFETYLVGGGVRDLLLGREPKDFDIATAALPEDVRKLFKNSRIIGRRFRLVHVRYGREIIEVATFRAGVTEEEHDEHHQQLESGRVIRDNVFGNLEDDAWRRDFTVNALYYDSRSKSVIDHVNGFDDLQQGVLRLIGDPAQRFREDPVRMIRAVRFAAKLGFLIEEQAAQQIKQLGKLLLGVPPARMFDEVLKLFHAGYAVETFELLRHYDLFQYLFPESDEALQKEDAATSLRLIHAGLTSTDTRINENKPVTPAFLFACLLWPALQLNLPQQRGSLFEAITAATEQLMRVERLHVTIPRRFSTAMREIWSMQPRLERRQGKRSLRLLSHPRFRAAYDFLLLRNEASHELQELCEWWTGFQVADEATQHQMLKGLPSPQGRRRRRPRGKKATDVATD